MNNRNDSNKVIVVLFVLFVAIVLGEITNNTLSPIWVALMGAIIIGLSLSSMLIADQKGSDDILNDR